MTYLKDDYDYCLFNKDIYNCTVNQPVVSSSLTTGAFLLHKNKLQELIRNPPINILSDDHGELRLVLFCNRNLSMIMDKN